MADSELPTIKVGDELHARLVGHRWSLYPMLEIGRAESHALVGISAAGRWSSPELPLVAEASVCTDAIPGLDTVRKFVGLMAGVRWWPGGPINPITFVDGGLAVSTQSEATSQGRYIGYGAGVELWFGNVFVFADVRRRSWSGDPFLRDAKPVSPSTSPTRTPAFLRRPRSSPLAIDCSAQTPHRARSPRSGHWVRMTAPQRRPHGRALVARPAEAG